MLKQDFLDAAEIIDAMRLFPRLLVGAYGYLVGWSVWSLCTWYERLPGVERDTQVTAFITIVLPGIFGLAVWVFKIYSDGGRAWDAPKDSK